MSEPAPRPTPVVQQPVRKPLFGLSRRAWLIAALAFGIGLVLFAMLWYDDRNNHFYRAEPRQESSAGQQFEPLPAPEPGGSATDKPSDIGDPGPVNEAPSWPQIVEQILLPAPEPPTPIQAPPPPPPPPPRAIAMAPGNTPVPIESPAPRYPPQALRRGESGTVLLRAHVGADGVPYAIDLVQSSGSRLLDHAASEALRRWRFRPAQRNGQPVPSLVQIPIVFNADG